MSTTTPAVENGTDRRIESGRLEKALSQDMAIDVVAPAMYDVHHDDAIYTIDVEGGACQCKDHQYRGGEYVCKHVIKACVRHAFVAESNTQLVARVLSAVRDQGCIHDETGCAGPTQLGERGYPCPGCVHASGAGEWVVWQRLVNGDTPADAPVAMTDGGVETATDFRGNERRATCRECGDRLLQGSIDIGEEVCISCSARGGESR